jgi:hypothetical protein
MAGFAEEVYLVLCVKFEGPRATSITPDNVDGAAKMLRTAFTWLGLPHPPASRIFVRGYEEGDAVGVGDGVVDCFWVTRNFSVSASCRCR